MIPLKSHLQVDKNARGAVYLQLANQLIHLIQSGIIRPGDKLPGTRKIANDLQLHRQTVVHAIEELELQGWVEILPRKGTIISKNLPELKARSIASFRSKEASIQAGFKPYEFPHLSPPFQYNYPLAFDDGAPDTRLAPVQELARAYARNLRHFNTRAYLGYTDARGSERLRSILAEEFASTRGLRCTADQIMITRGSQMAIYLSSCSVLKAGDRIVVGQTNYFTANMTFRHLGAILCPVRVDEHGLVVDDLAQLCSQHSIRAVYVTSHHHHPTTVPLSPERRLKLLELAAEHRFVIIEDDYDYEFHYNNSPLLPLASADRHGLVVYIGSFSKSIAPAFRIGYIVAPKSLIEQAICLRRVIDRQGDCIQELALADLIDEGILRRHLNKAVKQYRSRRDCFANALQKHLGGSISFRLPSGGMALWAHFSPEIDLVRISQEAKKRGLYLSDGTSFRQQIPSLNAIRMGFASMTEAEIEKAVLQLKELI